MEPLLIQILQEEVAKLDKKPRQAKKSELLGKPVRLSVMLPYQVYRVIQALSRAKKQTIGQVIQGLVYAETGVYSRAIQKLLEDDELADPVYRAVQAAASVPPSAASGIEPHILGQKRSEVPEPSLPVTKLSPSCVSSYLLGPGPSRPRLEALLAAGESPETLKSDAPAQSESDQEREDIS